MKKIFFLLLALVMVFMVGCKKEEVPAEEPEALYPYVIPEDYKASFDNGDYTELGYLYCSKYDFPNAWTGLTNGDFLLGNAQIVFWNNTRNSKYRVIAYVNDVDMGEQEYLIRYTVYGKTSKLESYKDKEIYRAYSQPQDVANVLGYTSFKEGNTYNVSNKLSGYPLQNWNSKVKFSDGYFLSSEVTTPIGNAYSAR